MSNRQNRPVRQIRGPQSALTDFLASQNISASRIRADAEARRRSAANVQDDQNGAGAGASTSNSAAPDGNEEEEEEEAEAGPSSVAPRSARALKRKKEAEAIDKIKKSKAFKKRKRNADDSDSDDIARAIFEEKSAPLPGQTENCEICQKRFTVTPYTPSGPNGGLLCSKCAKELSKDQADSSKKKRKIGPKGAGRRKTQSNLLDGNCSVGAKGLMTLCIETLAKNIELADDLGDLPAPLIDRVARILGKRRIATPENLALFLQPHVEEVKIYDGARMGSDDYIRIFQVASKLKTLKIYNAIQFKDEVMEYLVSRQINLESIYLHGASLLSEDAWMDFLQKKGKHLKALQVIFTDKHFGDDVIKSLKTLCPSLRRLKITHNQKITDKGIEYIAKLKGLEHLNLQLVRRTTTLPYVKVIESIGGDLRSFSLRGGPEDLNVDDRLLDAIHEHCRVLSKLRIVNTDCVTDAGFVRLFRDWANKPLTFLDFQKCRHIDAAKPRENEHTEGLCSDGFRALMKHSGKALKELNIHSCRHISREAFEDVFSANETYPELQKLEISFCEEVTDFIVGSIFRSCPSLKELNVFGCMKVREVRIPKGKILIGVPNAMGMMIEGEDD